MGRIPQAELERLKAEVSIERLARAQGLTLIRKGKDLFTRCLWHEGDREPSLVISPDKNLFHCLACNVGGSVVDWTMKTRKLSFTKAIAWLRADLPSLVAESPEAPPARPSHTRKPPGLIAADASDQARLHEVVAHYHSTLWKSPEALAYLQGRGITRRETLETFRVGFSDRSLGYELPTRDSRAGQELRSRLQALGVLRASGHEHLVGSIVVPIFDAAGNVVQMYGRRVNDRQLRAGTSSHLYLPSPLRGVWNRAALQASPEIILCEALFDALTFWEAGFTNVTTAYGVNHVPPELWEDFKAFGTRRVLIAFDPDEAGERAARELTPKLQAAGLGVFRIQFPDGMDVNELAVATQPAGESLARVIREAVWLGKGEAPALTTRAVKGSASEVEPAAVTTAAAPAEPPIAPASPPPFTQPTPASPSVELPAAIAPAPPPPETPKTEAAKRKEGEGRVAGPGLPGAGIVPAPAAQTAPPVSPGPAPAAPPASAGSAPGHATRPSTIPLTRDGDDLWARLCDRSYRIRDLEKNSSAATLKIQLRVSRDRDGVAAAGGYHLDALDLVQARQRQAFTIQAAHELRLTEETMKHDLAQLLLALEIARDQEIQRKLTPKPSAAAPVEMSADDREAALALLRSPDLLDQVLADFTRCGVVGEETNKLVGYLAATSRKLERPLAIIIQSSTAAGKSSLQDAVLAFMPEEEKVIYSAMTGQALFYMKETKLSHKILAIAEEEGAERAGYSLKILQSEAKLKIASAGKDPETGEQVTRTYEVEGPVMLILTTTALNDDEELWNRCLILTVDEGRKQTQAIHRLQRERTTLEGLLEDQARGELVKRHQNAQRLLRPLKVVNPFARSLTFLDHQTRTRRDHMKYLTLIEAIALLHQYQRPVLTARTKSGAELQYIEVTQADLALANRLASAVLPLSLDEMSARTRQLLGEITAMVAARSQEQGLELSEVRFTRREVREYTGLGATQTHTHLERLEMLEYVLPHGGGIGQPRTYTLLHPAKPVSEAAALGGSLAPHAGPGDATTTPNLSGGVGGVSGGCRATFGGVSAPPVGAENGSPSGAAPVSPGKPSKTYYRGNGGTEPDRTESRVGVGGAGPSRGNGG